MKYILILTVLLLSANKLVAQKVSVEVDKFTKQKKVISDWAPLDNGFVSSARIRFSSVDSFMFVTISCSGAYADVIGTNDETIFLFDDADTIKVWSPSIQSYDIGYYSSKGAMHSYVINADQVVKLASKGQIVSFRKYGAGGYFEGKVKSKNAEKVKRLAAEFLKAL